MICDGTADFLNIPEKAPHGGNGGWGGRGQCHSPQILCSAAPASAGAASFVSTRSVPVVVAVAATVGSVACVVVAADLAVHVEF